MPKIKRQQLLFLTVLFLTFFLVTPASAASWGSTVILDGFTTLLGDIFDKIAGEIYSQLTNLLMTPTDVMSNPAASGLLKFTTAVALAAVGVQVAFNALKMIISKHMGSSSSTGEGLFTRATLSVAMIFGTPWLATLVIELNNALVESIKNAGVDFNSVHQLFIIPTNFTSGLAIFMLMFLVMAIILTIMYGIRMAEIVFLIAMGPILALGIIDEESGAFGIWVRELFSVVFTQAIHMGLLYLFMNMIGAGQSITDYLTAMGLLVVMLKGPSLLRQFMYSSGTGGGVMAAGATAGRFAAYRMMVSKVSKVIPAR